MVCEYRREEAEGGGARDTESKTRTPHKVVGKNGYVVVTARKVKSQVANGWTILVCHLPQVQLCCILMQKERFRN